MARLPRPADGLVPRPAVPVPVVPAAARAVPARLALPVTAGRVPVARVRVVPGRAR